MIKPHKLLLPVFSAEGFDCHCMRSGVGRLSKRSCERWYRAYLDRVRPQSPIGCRFRRVDALDGDYGPLKVRGSYTMSLLQLC